MKPCGLPKGIIAEACELDTMEGREEGLYALQKDPCLCHARVPQNTGTPLPPQPEESRC